MLACLQADSRYQKALRTFAAAEQAADSFTEADTDDALAAKYTEWRVKHSAYTDAIWQISDHAARAEFVMLAVAAILWLLFTRRSLLD